LEKKKIVFKGLGAIIWVGKQKLWVKILGIY